MKNIFALIPRHIKAKLKLLTHHKSSLLYYFAQVGSIFVVGEYAFYFFKIDHLSFLGNLGTPLCALLIVGGALFAAERDKIFFFRSAIQRGDIETMALYIESGLSMDVVNNQLSAERKKEADLAFFWGYGDIFNSIKHDSPGDWGAPPPPVIDYDVNKYLLEGFKENPQLEDRFKKVADEMRTLLKFAYQKPRREITDRALVYSTNYSSIKRQNTLQPKRPGLPNEMIKEILSFSSYPRTSDTDRLRQYEVEDALNDPRPRQNNLCTRLMKWFTISWT